MIPVLLLTLATSPSAASSATRSDGGCLDAMLAAGLRGALSGKRGAELETL